MRVMTRTRVTPGPACVLAALALCFAVPSVPAQETGAPADLWRQATLYRDTWGVPHVYADTPLALGFAFGYAQAEDQLESILMAYRMVNGRLASLLGEAFAESDAFSLKMGHARLAEAALAQADPVTRDLCEGFALGINAWLVDHPDRAPAWADGARPADVLALWHAFLMSFAPFDAPGPYRRPPAMETGNAWAMAPSRTTEGAAVLVINPHQYYDGPFQWYEAHLTLGDMAVYGVTLRGLPVIVQGCNGAVGWGITPSAPDFADLFIEQLGGAAAGADPKSIRKNPEIQVQTDALMLLEYMSQAQPYYVNTGGALEERFTPAYVGPRGPVFEDKAGGLLSWRIGGYYDFGGLRQLVEMGRAQNLAMFQEALRMRQLPCFHIVYADREGSIFYLYNLNAGARAETPELPGGPQPGQEPLRWDRPLPVDLDMFAWAEPVPSEALPAVVNPESGYVQACGNPPWTATEGTDLNPANWPSWISRDGDGYRARRARQLLRTGQRSFRDNQSMIFDTVTPAAMDAVPALLAIADARPDLVQTAHPDLLGGLDLLREWNFVADTNSAAMTYFHVWWALFRAFAAPAAVSDRDLHAALAANTPLAQETAVRAAADAARTLRNEFQSMSVPWGDVHRLRRGSRDEAVPGAASGEPLMLFSDQIYDQGKWRASYGFGFAMAVQFGEQPDVVTLSPFGASDNPQSPHFSDQMDLLLERRFKPARLDTPSVMRHAEYAQGAEVTLLPMGVSGMFTFRANAPMQARLSTGAAPPEAPPEGYVPFTLYVKPERAPQGLATRLEVSMRVPESVCAPERLTELALFAYEEGLGWYQAENQQMDPQTRVFQAAQNVVGACYAVLGPAGAFTAPQETPEGVDDDAATEGPKGIDVLLQGKALPRPVATGKGTFKFDRLDKDKDLGAAAETDASPQGEGKTFKFERHDQPPGGQKGERQHLPMPEIPGYRFGRGIPNPFAGDAEVLKQKPGRIFKLEWLDAPQVPGAPEAPAPEEKAGDSAAASAPSAPQTPTPEAKDAEPQKPPAPEEEKVRKNFNTKVELPPNIPRDPNFVFGPAFREEQSKGQPAGGDAPKKGTFKMERLDKKE